MRAGFMVNALEFWLESLGWSSNWLCFIFGPNTFPSQYLSQMGNMHQQAGRAEYDGMRGHRKKTHPRFSLHSSENGISNSSISVAARLVWPKLILLRVWPCILKTGVLGTLGHIFDSLRRSYALDFLVRKPISPVVLLCLSDISLVEISSTFVVNQPLCYTITVN